MTTNNNYNFGLLTNSSALKTISFTVTISPSNSFTITQIPSDYTMDYYYTGDNQTISGITITNKNNKPFLIIPNTQIAQYVDNSAVVVSNLREIIQSVYPEGMVAVGEGQYYVFTSVFSMSSGLYPFPFTFYIID